MVPTASSRIYSETNSGYALCQTAERKITTGGVSKDSLSDVPSLSLTTNIRVLQSGTHGQMQMYAIPLKKIETLTLHAQKLPEVVSRLS